MVRNYSLKFSDLCHMTDLFKYSFLYNNINAITNTNQPKLDFNYARSVFLDSLFPVNNPGIGVAEVRTKNYRGIYMLG